MNLHAAIWTVDNATSRPADFRTIQAAIDAASVGDTLMIAGASNLYSSFTLTKRLIIKGPGDTLSGGLVSIIGDCFISEVTDTSSPDYGGNASGSLLEGVKFDSLYISENSQFVTVTRCEFSYLSASASNTILTRCIGNELIIDGPNCIAVGCRINNLGVLKEQISIDNCTIGNSTGSPIIITSSTNPTFRNTILISNSAVGTTPYSGATFDHCMAIGYASLPTGNGNVSLASSQRTNVFTTTTSFVLKAGGPAVGTGKNGVDMGMYGGISPFVDNFIPALPRITEIIVPPTVPDSSGLTFEVKAEARD